jgi:hypothetical protein
MARQWNEEIEEMKAKNPDIIKASWFRTHYLNEWCSDDDLLIIPAQKMQFVDFIPNARDWYYVLGVDLGFNDASSYTVVAASHQLKSVYCLSSFKATEQDFTAVANTIKSLKEKYPLTRIVVDGANKQGIEEMKQRMMLPELEIAEKLGKATYLRLLKDDVLTGAIKFLGMNCEPLKDEWSALQWLSVKGERKEVEDPRCQNHCSDSALYAWRQTYAYMAELAPTIHPTGSDEYYAELANKLEEYDEESRNEDFYFEGVTASEEVDW